MAYNPFNIFRRNQKAIFAVLTVFIMFMFVLSSGLSGGADFFDWFPRWLGGNRGDKICKIDGDDITTKDLEKVRFKRVMANRFMELSARYTELAIQDYLNDQQGRLGGQGQQIINDALQRLAMLEHPQIASLVIQQLPMMIEELNQVVESPNAREEDKAAARAVQALFRLIYQQRLGGDHYFANAPNKTNRDLIEFMLWEKKADALGIEFTEEDVKKLVQNEFYGFLGARDVQVRARLREDMQGFSDDACLKALAVEFKVRAAQKAMFGYGGLGAPAFVTPWELFDYYRDQCSPATYEVISVPTNAFVEKVTAEPTEAELLELYRKYKDDEPRPNRDTPGFKRPRKIAVAWISATGEEPYYKKLAEEHLRIGEVMAKSSGMLTVPVPGVGGAWLSGAGPLTGRELAVNEEYERYLLQFKGQLRNEYSSPTVLPWNLLSSSINRPGVMTSAAGAMGGQFPIGNPATAASLMMGAAITYEIRDRVNVGMPLVLGLMPGPSMMPTIVGGSAASKLVEPKPLPIEAMKPELIKTVLDRKAKELMREDLAKFMQELQKPNMIVEASLAVAITDPLKYHTELRRLSDPTKPKTPEQVAALEKYIKDFVTKRGIQMGGSSPEPGKPPGSPPMPRDEWTLEEDPGLKVLVDAQRTSLGRAKSYHGGQYIPFGRKFFWMESFTMQGQQRVPTVGLYVAQFYPEERPLPPDPFSVDGPAKPQYVVWRTKDEQAAPLDFTAARDSVKAAWKK
ncbi:MAG: hypothetical protein L0241_06280, partial [Planctomycetia bacterium]|nr:hypothetical protein [Planctomycetia bacterium]